MGCCCSEVSEYTKQLNKLKKAKTFVTKATSCGALTNDTMIKCGTEFKEAVILNQAEESIGEEILNAYKPSVVAISDAMNEVDSAITLVTKLLNHYKAEDRAWHHRHHH